MRQQPCLGSLSPHSPASTYTTVSGSRDHPLSGMTRPDLSHLHTPICTPAEESSHRGRPRTPSHRPVVHPWQDFWTPALSQQGMTDLPVAQEPPVRSPRPVEEQARHGFESTSTPPVKSGPCEATAHPQLFAGDIVGLSAIPFRPSMTSAVTKAQINEDVESQIPKPWSQLTHVCSSSHDPRGSRTSLAPELQAA